MQLCLNCGLENVEGVVFCQRCGVALGAVSVSTKKLGADEDDLSAGSPNLSDEYVVLLHFMGFDDPVALRVDEQVILGRLSPEEAGGMSVNLENFGAVDHGVSRRHAILIRQGTQLLIQDLGSTNHTFVNGEKLADDREYGLRDGDEISLGRLTFKIFFK